LIGLAAGLLFRIRLFLLFHGLADYMVRSLRGERAGDLARDGAAHATGQRERKRQGAGRQPTRAGGSVFHLAIRIRLTRYSDCIQASALS
jgi:hypothetical protein